MSIAFFYLVSLFNFNLNKTFYDQGADSLETGLLYRNQEGISFIYGLLKRSIVVFVIILILNKL